MNCAFRKAALIGLAALGAEPVSELRAHLLECQSCRAIFEHERNLFGSIDAGLRASAHVEVPASLLPQVRVRLNTQPVYTLLTSRLRTIALTIATAAVLLLSINSLRHRKHSQPPLPPSLRASPSVPANDTLASSAQPAIAKSSNKVFHRPVGLQQQPPPVARSAPEIIVSPDQEVLLAHYADQLNRSRNTRAVVTAQSTSVEPQSLEVDLIQIAQLEVKPLAEMQE
jgi:hypothetical protein